MAQMRFAPVGNWRGDGVGDELGTRPLSKCLTRMKPEDVDRKWRRRDGSTAQLEFAEVSGGGPAAAKPSSQS
ncbi:uncharacterized protein N7458_010943 [Penicillium daleae]|uniref:Uncharacterized protein n=1 Tax=Penicillium daleae TaxID=63821 RepID=A0AAD6FZU8_9EURO|nr:uncharacterized protein N7458_010943 [Penicillium daleae]KAJ5439945.1 hypothetical protein N7458_010943 [Penicillium daleae]